MCGNRTESILQRSDWNGLFVLQEGEKVQLLQNQVVVDGLFRLIRLYDDGSVLDTVLLRKTGQEGINPDLAQRITQEIVEGEG